MLDHCVVLHSFQVFFKVVSLKVLANSPVSIIGNFVSLIPMIPGMHDMQYLSMIEQLICSKTKPCASYLPRHVANPCFSKSSSN